jgi:hypothetical protein
MKRLLFVMYLTSGSLNAQTTEEAIKITLLAEARALKAHRPDEVRKYWKFDPSDTRHTIVSVNLPDGSCTSRLGADFVKDDTFPPPMPFNISNTDFKTTISGNLACANYQTTYTSPDGKAVKAHRVVTLEKVGKNWNITAISEHYYNSQ